MDGGDFESVESSPRNALESLCSAHQLRLCMVYVLGGAVYLYVLGACMLPPNGENHASLQVRREHTERAQDEQV